MFLFKRNGFYHLEYFDEVEGRNKRVSTKSKTKPQALKFLSTFNKNLARRTKVRYISLVGFKEEYLKFIRNTHSKNYARSVIYSFGKLIEYCQSDKPLSKISVREIEDFIGTYFNKSKHGAAHHYRTLKSAFNKAVLWNYLSINPFQKVKLPKIPTANPAFINENQLALIISSEPNESLRDLYLLAFHTGMRMSEILNLKWKSIDFIQREIKVQNTDSFTTKNKKDRAIPINATLFSMLQNRLPIIASIDRNDYVFEKSIGVKYSTFFISKQFKKASLAANMDKAIHFHSLRHSFISNLIQRGCPLTVAQQLAGHSQISVTLGYSHLLKENLEGAVRLLDKHNDETKHCL